ncbi:MAG TPA: hypothetical protein VEX38_07900, partial [Fimbriimonadaceae bacterium]|nr:hypothetical protein [Fimbriimonadaceae bacterium]
EMDGAKELLPPTAHEYQLAIEALQVWHEEREKVFFRPAEAGPDAYELPFELGNVSANDLARALERVLRRATAPSAPPVHKARRSLSDEMRRVIKSLSGEWVGLEVLLPSEFTREDAVYAFLAILELIRLGQARVQLGGEDVLFSRA